MIRILLVVVVGMVIAVGCWWMWRQHRPGTRSGARAHGPDWGDWPSDQRSR